MKNSNGFMTLKIELPPTEIVRTIVVPESMTLEDLNDAIQCVMGWEDAHLWAFQDGRRGPIYELPYEDNYKMSGGPPTYDASKVDLRQVFPKRGSKLTYEYDFGDSWDHTVTRMADPKVAEIACVKSTGPDGIEDIGGQYALAAFIEVLRENPKDEEWAETLEWSGFDDPKRRKAYLAGESAEAKTAKLKEALKHVKVAVPQTEEKKPKMSDAEQSYTLGLTFATIVAEEVWDILRDAMERGGKCEFYDDDKHSIETYLLTMFEGLKVANGDEDEPSTLTVHKKWVDWYATHGKDWKMMREQFDIVEAYARSVVDLYGAATLDDLYAIMKRYDPGLNPPQSEIVRLLEGRALWRGIGYRIDGNLIVNGVMFADDREDVEEAIEELLASQKEYPRWYPANREELFKWSCQGVYEQTPEVDRLELVLRSLCKLTDDEMEQAMGDIYVLITTRYPPDAIYKGMVKVNMIAELATKPRQNLLGAIEEWGDKIHLPCLNGNTVDDLRAREAAKPQEPKISRNAPCPCGSGKKYKMCCGKDK